MKPMVSNRILRDAVLKELEDDPEVVAKHITVTAVDGAIGLGGHVERYHEKHEAVRLAEQVQGVQAVADDIEVREPSLHERADDEIAEEVAHRRRLDVERFDSVLVQVRDGRVILHGQIDSEAHREEVETATRQLTGVKAVINLIKVEPTPASHS